MKAWMFGQPFFDVRMLMGGVVVGDQMHIQGFVYLCIELLQKFEKFVVTVVWQTFADNGSVVNIESCKQSSCPMALVIMGHGTRFSWLDRQAKLNPIQCLNLAFLIHRKHEIAFSGGSR